MLICKRESHQVRDLDSSVVHVSISGKCFSVRCAAVETVSGNEWVRYHAVASLEANLGLEGAWVDGTNHLEGYIWAVE